MVLRAHLSSKPISAALASVSDARLVFAARDVTAVTGKSSVTFMAKSVNR